MKVKQFILIISYLFGFFGIQINLESTYPGAVQDGTKMTHLSCITSFQRFHEMLCGMVGLFIMLEFGVET